MRNYIILNGKNSNTIQGLIIQSLAPITKPMIRTQVEEIDGRDGDIVTPLGYSSYDKTITIGLYGDYDVNEVIEYFNSNGIVTFSNESDKYYKYQINAQIDFERLIRFKTATVTMHCQPFKYSTTEQPEILSPTDELLTIPDWQQITNGVTVSCTNGVISVSGTPTSATEFYLPITALALQAGSYTLTASANGQNPNNCSIRMIGSAPSDADSFGGRYISLVQGTTSLSATLSASKTFNYIWFYMSAGATVGFTLTLSVAESAKATSGEGTNIVLENSAEAPVRQFYIKGNTGQTTYSGKNLLNDFVNPVSNTLGDAGITATVNADGTISTSGTTTGTYKNIRFDVKLPAGTYWFGGCPSGGSVDTYSFCVQPVGSGIILDTGSGNTFTLAEEKWVACYPVRIGGDTGYSMDGKVFKPILVAGSTATAFEPYVGGIASPNPDYPQNVRVVTGYNEIKIIGKNVAHFVPNTNSYVLNGITPSYDSMTGEIHFSGALTATWSNVGALVRCSLPAGFYTVSTNVSTDRYRKIVKLTYADGTYVNAIIAKGQTSGTVTTTKEVVSSYIYIDQATEGDVLNETYTLQLEKSSTITSFEPYKEQSLEVNLGKNMFDKNAIVNGSYINSDGTETLHGSFGISDYMPVQSGAQYAYSGSTNETGYGAKAAWYDKNKNIVGSAFGFGHSGVITAPSGASYVRFSVRVSVGDANTFQLEKGSYATSYAPYFIPIELCKIDNYQDYIYKSGNKWYKHKEVGKKILTGDVSESWQSGNMMNVVRYNTPAITDVMTNTSTSYVAAPTLCSHFQNVSPTENWETPVGTANYSLANNTKIFRFTKGEAIESGDTDAFRAWLATNPVTLYYVLATAVEEEITNENLKAQLESLNQANSCRVRTHIGSIFSTGNEPCIMSAEALANADGTITNMGNIYSKPKLTIFGSGDIAVYLNNVQMFQIALGDNQYITIDTAALEAYKDTTETLMNRLVTGDYQNFKFQVGDNTLTFSGTVTECVVENYSRWL